MVVPGHAGGEPVLIGALGPVLVLWGIACIRNFRNWGTQLANSVGRWRRGGQSVDGYRKMMGWTNVAVGTVITVMGLVEIAQRL
jgi:hypothetical protein